jgi:hypothetical protein
VVLAAAVPVDQLLFSVVLNATLNLTKLTHAEDRLGLRTTLVDTVGTAVQDEFVSQRLPANKFAPTTRTMIGFATVLGRKMITAKRCRR